MRAKVIGLLACGLFVKLSIVGCGGPAPEAESPTNALGAAPAQGGAAGSGGACTKDTDCKGDRICVKSACADPGAGK